MIKKWLALVICMLYLPFGFSEDSNAHPLPLQTTEETKMPDPFDGVDYKTAFFKTLLWIICILAAVFFLLWLLKRLSNKRFLSLNHNNYVKIIEKRPLSPKTLLYVIEIGHKHFLIAESQLEVRLLSSIQQESLQGEDS